MTRAEIAADVQLPVFETWRGKWRGPGGTVVVAGDGGEEVK